MQSRKPCNQKKKWQTFPEDTDEFVHKSKLSLSTFVFFENSFTNIFCSKFMLKIEIIELLMSLQESLVIS